MVEGEKTSGTGLVASGTRSLNPTLPAVHVRAARRRGATGKAANKSSEGAGGKVSKQTQKNGHEGLRGEPHATESWRWY